MTNTNYVQLSRDQYFLQQFFTTFNNLLSPFNMNYDNKEKKDKTIPRTEIGSSRHIL